MSAISITPASVIPSAQAVILRGRAGATITAGQALYIDTADGNKLKLADANGAPPLNTFAGLALVGASNNQPILYTALDPNFGLGGSVLAGDTIWLSGTPGGITKTFGDFTTGDTIIALGVALTTGTFNLNPTPGGVVA